AIRGSNLFHSFKEFNIDSGKSVYFSNPSTIQNILTRVTGKNSSQIFGKLGVLGNANLFLMNPNGIIFGQDASLDISGSFTATTSPSILFNNGFEFSSTNPNDIPLLKVNIIPGLQYPSSQQGDIVNQGKLTVGRDLNLIGKNLNLTGSLNSGRDLNLKASDTLQVRDNSTNPFIASAGRDLLLQANQTIDIFALNHPDSGLFSGNDLVLQSSKPVLGDARYFSGGNFRIEQLDGTNGDLSSPNDPIIRASGDVSFDSYTGASLHILAGGSVNITGDVTITGADGTNGLEQTVTLSDGESLEINGKNQATLDIRAGTTDFGTPGITGSGNFTPGNPNTGGSGSSSDIVIDGNIKVNTADGLVFLSNQYSPNTTLNSGNIQINGNIDTSNISGNAGKIILDSLGNIDIISSQIIANSLTSSSGNISLISGGIISILDGTAVKSESSDNKSGNFVPLGNINFNAASIIVDNSEISTTTNDSEAGDIILNASDEVKIGNNSKIASGAIGTGEAGFLKIITDKLTISDDSKATVSSQDTKEPGFISIEAENVTLSNKAEIFATTVSGDGGNIELKNLKILQLTDGSLISASTTNGISGNVSINATESINIDSGSGVIADATGTGKAGNINITTSQFNLDNNAIISVSNRGTGNAGELQINASNMKLDNGAKIFAE
ncbi:MAG: filamentous hemagglutinin N-terminal domain-containing protein, partial [Rivularia sp. ALOHA_DT_140]|nr:filamentous hemagglutinin N-terminal domain-containing protein [Rivularia sp. ALOHA_DT_140]